MPHVLQGGSLMCSRAPGPYGTAMTRVGMCQIVTTTMLLTSAAHMTPMVQSRMCSTRATDVNVLSMEWNCPPTCIRTIQWMNRASTRMPATSRFMAPVVPRGIKCLALHGSSTAQALQIGATQCTIGVSCHGALSGAIARPVWQVQHFQGQRSHS